MNLINKTTRVWNVVCTVIAFAMIILVLVLEVVQFNIYQQASPPPSSDDDWVGWGKGLVILAVIVLWVYAVIPMGVGAILQLVSAIGIFKSQTKARRFLIVGIVGKFFTAITLILFAGLMVYCEVPGIFTKALYVVLGIGYIIIAALQIKLFKQMKNTAQNVNRIAY